MTDTITVSELDSMSDDDFLALFPAWRAVKRAIMSCAVTETDEALAEAS